MLDRFLLSRDGSPEIYLRPSDDVLLPLRPCERTPGQGLLAEAADHCLEIRLFARLTEPLPVDHHYTETYARR